MSEVMMLAKNLNLKQVKYPVVITEKLDGVPADFSSDAKGVIHVRTRQNEPLYSVNHIRNYLRSRLLPHHHLIGELYVPGMKFKDIGGLVRAEASAPQLLLNVFDYYRKGQESMPYGERMEAMVKSIGSKLRKDSSIRLIPGYYAKDEAQMLAYIDEFMANNPASEGVIIRSLSGPMEIGKRSWNFQRVKRVDTVDLVVVGFDEAVSKAGVPKGMVGGINVEYNGVLGNAGPGSMTHKERVAVWNNPKAYIGKIGEFEHKPDDSYVGLREGVFKRWRDDKTEPNEE